MILKITPETYTNLINIFKINQYKIYITDGNVVFLYGIDFSSDTKILVRTMFSV